MCEKAEEETFISQFTRMSDCFIYIRRSFHLARLKCELVISEGKKIYKKKYKSIEFRVVVSYFFIPAGLYFSFEPARVCVYERLCKFQGSPGDGGGAAAGGRACVSFWSQELKNVSKAQCLGGGWRHLQFNEFSVWAESVSGKLPPWLFLFHSVQGGSIISLVLLFRRKVEHDPDFFLLHELEKREASHSS